MRRPTHSSVWVAADDGSGARRLASGSAPRISPDSKTIATVVGPEIGTKRLVLSTSRPASSARSRVASSRA
jgi:hypothetical protein